MAAHDSILTNQMRILQSKVSMVRMGSLGKDKTGRTHRTCNFQALCNKERRNNVKRNCYCSVRNTVLAV